MSQSGSFPPRSSFSLPTVGESDVAIRPAATVMVVRDAPTPNDDGSYLQVLMVRRNLRSDFVGGAYVFPGGTVDPLDGGPDAEALCAGRSDEEASAVLKLPFGGLAYWVAVVRETFEEAGLLLATRDGGSELRAGDHEEEARLSGARAAVNAGSLPFLDLCRDERLRLEVGEIHYFAHWITPRGTHRRYDTRFFVAAAPPGQNAAHDAGETIDEVWISPHDALARQQAREIQIIFPTIRNLQAIARFDSSSALLGAAAAASDSVPTMSPASSPTRTACASSFRAIPTMRRLHTLHRSIPNSWAMQRSREECGSQRRRRSDWIFRQRVLERPLNSRRPSTEPAARADDRPFFRKTSRSICNAEMTPGSGQRHVQYWKGLIVPISIVILTTRL